MAFSPRKHNRGPGRGEPAGAGIAGAVGSAGKRLIWLAARFCLAVSVIAVLSGAVLVLRLAQGVDMLIHEGTYAPEEGRTAHQRGHSTMAEIPIANHSPLITGPALTISIYIVFTFTLRIELVEDVNHK